MTSKATSRHWRIEILFCLLASPLFAANTVSLDALIEQASRESEEIRSIDLTLKSTEAEISARDFELSPRLTTEIAQVEDQRATFSPGRRSLSRLVDINLVKPFSTGTTVALQTGYEAASVANIGTRNIATWQLTLTQSLWRNGFGRNTRLRRDADAAELEARRLDLLLRRQRFLVDLESAYWDLALSVKERDIRVENLERSEELAKWIKKRLSHSAAEPTDLFQIEALISTRRLELLGARNRVVSAWNRLRQILPGLENATWQPALDLLEQARDPMTLLPVHASPGTTPRRIDALAGQSRVVQARSLAAKENDSLRPAVDFVAAHGRNGIENSFGSAWSSATGSNSTYTKVGVQFSMDLDAGTKADRIRALELQADARELDAKRLERESAVGWEDLRSRLRNLNESLENAYAVSAAQKRKSQEEKKRFNLGRSTAFQTISFEIDAANADLDVYRLLTELRKTESQSRLYTDAGVEP